MRTWIFRCGRNLMFDDRWPMRGGKFPWGHPCADDPKPTVMSKYRTRKSPAEPWKEVPGEQPESDTALGRFRARGYWASCFPEGDGITFEPLNGQSQEQAMADISECFGVELRRE